MKLSLSVVILLIAATICVDASADPASESDQSNEHLSQIEDTTPATVPYYSTGIPSLDAYIVHPVVYGSRTFRAIFRGTVEALRDHLFIDYVEAGTSKKIESPLNKPMEGEGWDDFRDRKAVRNYLVDTSQAYGVWTIAKEQPDVFRYGIAITLGLLLMSVVFFAQFVAAKCSRWCLYGIFKATQNEAWLDEADYYERITQQAAADKKSS